MLALPLFLEILHKEQFELSVPGWWLKHKHDAFLIEKLSRGMQVPEETLLGKWKKAHLYFGSNGEQPPSTCQAAEITVE